jgi:hypothetical protein
MISNERGIPVVYSLKDADDFLNMLPSELCKYVIDKELLHTGWDICWRDRMVVGFTTTYAISAYHH